jgi:hypothetical protein
MTLAERAFLKRASKPSRGTYGYGKAGGRNNAAGINSGIVVKNGEVSSLYKA